MYDFSYTDFIFEHERSRDKENALTYDLTSMADDCAELDALIDDLFDAADLENLITASGANTRGQAELRMKKALRSLLWHLHQAMNIDADCYVRLSLRTAFYAKSSVRNPHGITRVLRDIVHRLTETGWIECHKGFLDRTSGVGKTTRVRATLSLMTRLKSVPRDLVECRAEKQTVHGVQTPAVIFRRAGDKAKTPLELCAVDPVIIAAEALLSLYNARIADVAITLGSRHKNFLRLPDGQTINLNRTSLTAIYHVEEDGRITYGRMHGGFWQNIPRALRSHLRIDNQPTVEFDYSAQALNIVAALEGGQITGDGYDIDLGLSGVCPAFERRFVKTCIVVLLNARDRKSAYRAIRQAFRNDMTERGVSDFLRDENLNLCREIILEKHPFLGAFCCSGRGKDVLGLDAELARDILKIAMEADIIVLPIHDGFITTAADAGRLNEIMHTAWQNRFGTTISITCDDH